MERMRMQAYSTGGLHVTRQRPEKGGGAGPGVTRSGSGSGFAAAAAVCVPH